MESAKTTKFAGRMVSNTDQDSKKPPPRDVIGTLQRGYRLFISPLLGPRCRFYPSCSQYCVDCVRRFGWLRERYDSLAPAFVAHALHNGLILSLVMTWPQLLDAVYR